MKKITVITPSYNRAHTLPACYESLLKQTSKDFLWLIIDDGSSDYTQEIVTKWQNDGKGLSIRYVKKENGGKASALNVAFGLLDTQYATILDSDDTFTPNAIQDALEILASHENESGCCGLMAFRHDTDGCVMGGRDIPLSSRYTMMDTLNGRYNTELICFYKSTLLRKHKFPHFNGEKFVSPQWLDYELSRHHYFVTSDHKFCICEYISDGLTKNKQRIIKKNPKGYTAVKRQSYEFSNSFLHQIKHGIMYGCGCLLSGESMIKNSPRKWLSVFISPLSYLVYILKFK